jgi:hypothetical protein
VRITEPRIIAFHGIHTRTRRSLFSASPAAGDASLASLRAMSRLALGNARSPTLRSTVRTTDNTIEMTSHGTVSGSRELVRRRPSLPADQDPPDRRRTQ